MHRLALPVPFRAVLAAVLALALLATACGGSDSSDDQAGSSEEGEPSPDGDEGVETTEAEAEATEVPPEPTEAPTAGPPIPSPAPCGEIETGASEYQLEGGGAEHDVMVFVPSGHEADERLPVVLNWHGLGSNGSEQAAFTAFEALAEQEGFMVVHPTGIPVGPEGRNSWELSQFDVPDLDDVAFANALIDDLVDRFCGDPRRVYSTGMSNGGLFTSRLVCELSHRIAAASSVAGLTHPDECVPARPVPYMAIHGTADAVVPYDGTKSTSPLADQSLEESVDFFAQVMPEEFAQFAMDMGCDAEPAETPMADDVIRHDYGNCDNDVPLSFFEVIDGGHTWPGTPFAEIVTDQLGYTTDTVLATEDSWAFFREHQLPEGPVWEEVAGGEDCMCSDGSDWSFWVREADPAKVVLYFQGGGACFNATTCSFTNGTYKVNTGSFDNPTGGDGIFDFDNPANPFAGWSFVFVPYCTADVHIGDNTQDYGDGLVVEHNGFTNATRALDELVNRFPDAEEVFVAGSSAGGVPSPLFAGLVVDELVGVKATALSDGSGAYADNPTVNAAIGALWGTFENVPDWPVNEGLTPSEWSIPGLFVQAGLHAPEIVMARHDHAFDAVQEQFAVAAGVMSADLLTLIDANAAQIETEGVPVSSYVAPGTDHTILGRPEFYTQVVDGVALVDWVTTLAGGEVAEDVHCVACEG